MGGQADVVKGLLAAVSAGDVDAMAEFWTDDFVLDLPYADPPSVLEGKETVRAYLREALAMFSLRLTVTEVYECPDRDVVVAEYTSEGAVTTTGKQYANRYIGVFTLRGDRVARQREYYNPLPAARALAAD